MWPDSYKIDVSHETEEKLKIYHDLLLKWQKAINLVSPKTINEAWIRHFLDSAQIVENVSRESISVADIGSGAGFPGLVLSIMRPDLNVTLIESDERKCQFLRTVSRETDANAKILNMRIEDAADEVQPEFVTARALSDLKQLLDYTSPWFHVNHSLECVFLKGANYRAEIEAARKHYDFECEAKDSLTDPVAKVLCIKNIGVQKA